MLSCTERRGRMLLQEKNVTAGEECYCWAPVLWNSVCSHDSSASTSLFICSLTNLFISILSFWCACVCVFVERGGGGGIFFLVLISPKIAANINKYKIIHILWTKTDNVHWHTDTV